MINEKLEHLRSKIRSMGKVAIAYSGGVDSTLLLQVARDVSGDDAVAIMNVSPLISTEDVEDAFRAARFIGAEPLVVRSDPLDDPEFRRNSRDRCYRCKRLMFSAIMDAARERGIDTVIDGSHIDDLEEDRPGRRALNELGIRSPLQEVGLNKGDVRDLARRLSIPSADRPSDPCLATRIPFGQEITEEALRMAGRAERALKEQGFGSVRVRHHGTVARIEVPLDEFSAIVDMREGIVEALRSLGFVYVTVDLQGLRPGSMSEAPDESGAG